VNIIGMHVAARTTGGYNARGIARPIPLSLIVAKPDGVAQGGVEMNPNMPYIGPIPFPVPPPHSETVFVKSPIAYAEMFGIVDRAPAHLGFSKDCPYSSLDLMKKELNECSVGSVKRPYDQQDVDAVFASIAEHFEKAWDPVFGDSVRVLTLKEALNGRGTYIYLKPTSLKTSSGYHFCVLPGARGKHHLIVGEPGQLELLPDAMVAYLKFRLLMMCDKPPPVAVLLHLKDELRSLRKNRLFKTRIISNLPFVHTLMMREYFGAFVNFTHGSFNRMASGVGMNPQSGDWNTMICYLKQVASHGFDGDFTKFEKYFVEQLADAMLDMINDWYRTHGVCTEEDVRIRKNLVYCVLNCWVIVGQDYWEQFGDLKSGIFATTAIWGNLMCMFFLRYAWMLAARKYEPSRVALAYYEKYVRAKVFGDDNMSGVHDVVLPWYNRVTVCEVLASIGVVYTPADKDAVCTPYDRIEDLQFLQYRTRNDAVGGPPRFPGVNYLSIPELSGRFFGCCVWISKKLDPRMATICNVNDVLRRAFGLSREDWHELRRKFESVLSDVGIYGQLLTWDDCYHTWGKESCFVDDFDDPMVPLGWWDVPEWTLPPDSFVRKLGYRALRRLYFVPQRHLSENEFDGVAQMDSAVEQRPNLDTVNTSSVLGVPSSASRVERAVYDQSTSLVEFVKRYSTWKSGIGEAVYTRPLCASMVIAPTAPFAKCGHLYWFAQCFRYYVGDFRVLFRSNLSLMDVAYMTADVGLNVEDCMSSTDNVQGCPPTGYAETGFNINAFEVPWVSQFPITGVPRNESEAITEECSSGSFSWSITPEDGNGKIFVAGGDNFRFGFLEQIPRVMFEPLPLEQKYDGVAQASDGVSFEAVEEKVVSSDGGRPSTRNAEDLGEVERPFSVVQLAERWTLVSTTTWSTSDATNALLFRAVVPQGLIVGVNGTPFSTFMFYRGDVKIRVKVQSTPFQLGQLIGYFVPERDGGYIDAHMANSRTSQSVLPHLLVQAGGNREGDYHIPWLHHQTQLLNTEPVSTGTFDLRVFNSLETGVGATQTYATVQIWVSFVNSTFQVLRPVPSPPFESEFEMVDGIAQGGVMSGLAAASNIISTAKETIDFANKVSQKHVGRKLLDRPAITLNPQAVASPGGVDLCNTKQVENLRYLGGCAADSSVVTFAQFATARDEMELANFVGRLSFYTEVNYSTGMAGGTTLFTCQMCPVPEIFGAAPGSFHQMTSCGYASSIFGFWSGDFVVSIQVVSTKGHGGQIVCFPLYGRYIPTSDLAEATSAYARVIDVSEPTTTEIVIPWRSTAQMLRVPHESAPFSFRPFSMGLFQISAVCPLQASDTVSPSVHLNISFCLRNYKFSFLSEGMTRYQIGLPLPVQESVLGKKLRYTHRPS